MVGTIIKQFLRNRGYTQHAGCGCAGLTRHMNQLGPDGCRAQISQLSSQMKQSAIKWKKADGSIWPIPPLIVFRQLILWACDEAERQSG